ncbi:phosphoglucosamine mutase [Sulfolobus sp. A20]|uniref:phosphoglucosamine mutase n=1 Tax=Sulfolobaceae TaxID=118883 RepID=UPI000845ED22|nr:MULTISPECIES: phosphoglucosamine mutase [unclassified Sulfolobus]TRM77070.1 phosphoglucosamine mutase [Sulfolobus sp. B5]TRM77786.1 phosphoglucosamine mutase [Sulfolobus sp. A20-N-F8]TRM80937.1 phosphoglucosamine mutase [Sulfolobus sp. D5]TRM94747.1 phosphoglucosamine mutase [Sulfolobus sp. A20-N-G8]TRN03090.1 phosphoglucosamine mutase [Sulfolobus sp. E1]
MGKLFGTDGVRGVTNRELTLEQALRLSKAIGTYFGKGSRILVGRDVRAGGDMIMKVVEGGLLSTGVVVYDGGMAPTPTLQYAVKTLGYDGGVVVTASHNPPEYNGIKVVSPHGIEISREEENKIEDIYFNDTFNSVEWNQLINDVRREEKVIDVYIKGILSHVDVNKIREKRYRILIDPANSVGGITTPILARELGCKVFTVNGNLDPLFSARMPEPTFESLAETARISKELNVDLTVAHDGDADRAIFIDSKGRIQWGDRSGTLLSYWASVKAPNLPKRVFTAVSSSSLVEEYLSKFNIQVKWIKVGSVDIAYALFREGGVAGFEENGGFMFPPHQGVRDGGMAFALMLDMMASENESSSSLFDRLPTYHLIKTKVKITDKTDAQNIYHELIEKYGKSRNVITIDGVKVIDKDFWFLVRKSGTEPIIRILVEAKDENYAKELAKELEKIVGSLV